jgi:hypothetical protein
MPTIIAIITSSSQLEALHNSCPTRNACGRRAGAWHDLTEAPWTESVGRVGGATDALSQPASGYLRRCDRDSVRHLPTERRYNHITQDCSPACPKPWGGRFTCQERLPYRCHSRNTGHPHKAISSASTSRLCQRAPKVSQCGRNEMQPF